MFRSVLLAVFLTLAAASAGLAQEPLLGDPMRPYRVESAAGAQTAGPRPLQLSAILVSEKRRIALINGRFYREGDAVGGAQITRIESGSVRLRRGGEDLVVRLVQDGTSPTNTEGDPAP